MAKQVIVMRKDLQMTKGKMIAQGAHASMGVLLRMMNNGESIRRVPPEIVDGEYSLTLNVEVGSIMDDWLMGVFKKIAVYVNSEEELMEIYNSAKEKKLPVALIEDTGLTMFKGVKTKTCLAIGPAIEEDIDEITGHLRLL